MYILGLHVGHNASVFLLKDGRVLGGLSQEKLDNIKNSAAFPRDAIKAVLAEARVSLDDIDHIAIAGHQIYPHHCYAYLFHTKPTSGQRQTGMIGLAHKVKKALPRQLARVLFAPLHRYRQKQLLRQGRLELEENLRTLRLDHLPRSHVEHHTCHARAAFHGLGATAPALIFTADGSGDHLSSTVSKIGEHGAWRRLGATGTSASIGGIYSATTRFLGMRPLEHEYKVMGLAPYAKGYGDELYERLFASIIFADRDDPYRFASSQDTQNFYQYLTQTAVGERFDNIAAAAQRLIEESTIAWIERSVAQAGIRRAYFSGGLFMNVKLNKRIQELECLDAAFFLPSCGDETNALGAAYHVAAKSAPTTPLKDLYLGLSFPDDEIEALLSDGAQQGGFTFERPQNINETVAQLLADGHVVARFDGANEWGARSLGNRAILAHPGRMESFFTINDQIKCRDFWMPFAPTILDPAAPRYLQGWSLERTPAAHMITAFQATPKGTAELCAAIHRGDGTLRPQVLTRDVHRQYYDLIERFEAKTGIGALLNTSLNLHGKPLVATPQQALETLTGSNLRHMMMGPFLIRKNTRPAQ